MSDNENLYEVAGSAEQSRYAKYFFDSFDVSGSPKNYNLEKILADPQNNIKSIIELAKYYYAKNGLIMRVVNIIRDFGANRYNIVYPAGRKRVKNVIDRFNERIRLSPLITDMMFELALTGNLAGYDRDGKRVDIYPLTIVEPTNLIIDNEPQLKFHLSSERLRDSLGIGMFDRNEELIEKLAKAYPKEVITALAQNKDFALLDTKNSFFRKLNSSRYEKYGLPFVATAFDELAHKTLLKQAESATAMGIIEQVMLIKIGNQEKPPSKETIEYFEKLFLGKKGALRAVVPNFVEIDFAAPETSVFDEKKYTQVDKDLLTAVGVSVTLIRGEGGGNYSEGYISVAGLARSIETIRACIPDVVRKLWKAELARKGLNPEYAPYLEFDSVEIDRSARQELIQWLFTHAGLPYEVLYDEVGMNYDYVKLIRQSENANNTEEVFRLHQQPFQGGGQVTDDDKGGRPKKNLTERKTDANQSNNDSPRPSTSK